jgi:cytochrome c553
MRVTPTPETRMPRLPLTATALLVAASLGLPTASRAADLEAGKAKAQTVCAACHGANGVSVSDTIPNLAGQRGAYLATQLKAWKDGSRKNAIMNAIGAQLSDDDIANVAAHFAAQPPAGGAAKSAQLPNLAKSGVTFPANWRTDYKAYDVIDFPAAKQVRHYYANPVALQAAKAGQPMPDGAALLAVVYAAKLDASQQPVKGTDGHFVADQPVAYTAMAREAGWGADMPDMLRNENWNYAAFTAAGVARSINQAECLACHKPLDKTSYMFTLAKLTARAQTY